MRGGYTVGEKSCRGCRFWRKLCPSMPRGRKVCNYMVDTGVMRKAENGVCLSRQEGQGRGNQVMRLADPVASTLAGTKRKRRRR